MSAPADTMQELNDAAARVVALVRAQSPGVSDGYLLRVMAIATEMLLADDAFPERPNPELFPYLGQLVGHGGLVATMARIKVEKETCKGAA